MNYIAPSWKLASVLTSSLPLHALQELSACVTAKPCACESAPILSASQGEWGSWTSFHLGLDKGNQFTVIFKSVYVLSEIL